MEHQHSCAVQRPTNDHRAGCCGRCHKADDDKSASTDDCFPPAGPQAQEEIGYVAELGYN